MYHPGPSSSPGEDDPYAYRENFTPGGLLVYVVFLSVVLAAITLPEFVFGVALGVAALKLAAFVSRRPSPESRLRGGERGVTTRHGRSIAVSGVLVGRVRSHRRGR